MAHKTAVLCDHKTTMAIVQHLLKKLGFSVFMAASGKKGLILIREKKPQLVITDVDNPARNGIGILRGLTSGGSESPLVIAFTFNESPEHHAKVKALGAREVIVKPFKPADLAKKVQALMEKGTL